jgi:hypothetical protein
MDGVSLSDAQQAVIQMNKQSHKFSYMILTQNNLNG